MDFSECEELTKTHECSQCQGALVVLHAAGSEAWIVKCGQDHAHIGVKRIESVTTAIARGQGDSVMGKGSQKAIEATLARNSDRLSLSVKKDVATGDVITVPMFNKLAAWSSEQGLNAYLGHVCLYYGSPYVTIDGYYYLLNSRSPAVSISTRPLNNEERQLYQIGDGDYAWIAEAHLLTTKIPTTGLGIVTKEELDAPTKKVPSEFKAPIARAHPQRMAEKRAEWQLLRKIVSIGQDVNMPGIMRGKE